MNEPWVGRSHISIFVRCLHLLDLDLLEDWPAITEKTLSTKASQQGLQRRIRAVEWSLFRLLELHSPKEAQDVGCVSLDDSDY
jgi:HAUS augmin-like complex subunit 6 N-terminus